MTRISNGGKGYTVQLDNLFTSSKLLSILRSYGIGAAGTIRTGQTKREENKEKRQQKEPVQNINYLDPKPNSKLSESGIFDSEILDSEILDSEVSNPQFQQTISSIQKIRQDIHQTRFQDRTIKKSEKEKNFGMNEKLTELKVKWSNYIAWGKLYECLSSNQKVLQLA